MLVILFASQTVILRASAQLYLPSASYIATVGRSFFEVIGNSRGGVSPPDKDVARLPKASPLKPLHQPCYLLTFVQAWCSPSASGGAFASQACLKASHHAPTKSSSTAQPTVPITPPPKHHQPQNQPFP